MLSLDSLSPSILTVLIERVGLSSAMKLTPEAAFEHYCGFHNIKPFTDNLKSVKSELQKASLSNFKLTNLVTAKVSLMDSDKDKLDEILSETRYSFKGFSEGDSYIDISEIREEDRNLYLDLIQFFNLIYKTEDPSTSFSLIDLLYIY